jgi:hypothetical protein
MIYNHRGEKHIVVSDNEGYFLVFKGNNEKGGSVQFKSKVFSG